MQSSEIQIFCSSVKFFEAAAKWGKQKRVRKLKQLGEENKLKKEWCGY